MINLTDVACMMRLDFVFGLYFISPFENGCSAQLELSGFAVRSLRPFLYFSLLLFLHHSAGAHNKSAQVTNNHTTCTNVLVDKQLISYILLCYFITHRVNSNQCRRTMRIQMIFAKCLCRDCL